MLNVNTNRRKKMDKDQIINALSRLLQKRNTDIINLELQIEQLTSEVNANKKEEKKENKDSEK
jgi:transcriptional regulator NrdR family protein